MARASCLVARTAISISGIEHTVFATACLARQAQRFGQVPICLGYQRSNRPGFLAGENPGVAGLIVKLQNCQLNFDMAALAIDVMGELGALYDHTKYERERGWWQAHSFFSLGLIIGGGTAQIQKNIIAERGLGLPREPKPAAT